jgi:ubiquinone/menaquinone biosynthesis C-methylase UbiE
MRTRASLSPLLRQARGARRRFMLWSFERLYHEFAWSYDLVAAAVSGGYWRHWIVACVPYLRAERVLELGCGTGYLQAELRQRGIAHVGLDASPQMLRGARRRLRHDLRLLEARAPWLPFPDGSFSDAVATFPAPYLLQTPTLDAIRRVLHPSGQLVIVDGGAWSRGTPARQSDALDAPGIEHYRQRLTAHGWAVRTHLVAVGPTSTAVIVAHQGHAEP